MKKFILLLSVVGGIFSFQNKSTVNTVNSAGDPQILLRSNPENLDCPWMSGDCMELTTIVISPNPPKIEG